MALKKSQLYSSIWSGCDELRGGMDASQYKDYVLVILFVKYVSDKAASQQKFLLDVPRGGSFADMVALKGDKEIGDKINKIIAKLAEARKGIFMIDASKGFMKDGNKNRLRDQDIHRIVDTFDRMAEIPRFSRMVPLSEISDPKNDFNLNIPRYIDSTEPEDLQDIDGHLRGGIPNRDIDALDAYWQVFPSVRVALFKKADRPGYCQLKVLVVDDKWLATIGAAVQSELDRVSQTLTGRIRQLAERYETPMPQLARGLAALEAKVAIHLNTMGFMT